MTRQPGTPLGIEVEGGVDTPLQYIYVKSLQPGSVSEASGLLKHGDQLISCGEAMLVGVTSVEAWDILNQAPPTVKITAARKYESLVRLRKTEKHKSTESLNQAQQERIISRPVSIHNRRFSLSLNFSPASELNQSVSVSTENVSSIQPTIEESTPSPKMAAFRPSTTDFQEQEFFVTLTREEGQKLGFSVTGGSDDPNLPHPHVS